MKAGDTYDLWTVGQRAIAAGGGDRFIEVTCRCGFRGYALESALKARKSKGCPTCVANGEVAREKGRAKGQGGTIAPASPCPERTVQVGPDSTPAARPDRPVSGRKAAPTPPEATATLPPDPPLPPPKSNAKLDRLARRKAGKIRRHRPKVHPADWTPKEPKPRAAVTNPDGTKRPYRREIVPGERHGRWTVLGLAPPAPDHRMVYVRCDCGTERAINPSGLWSGTSASCGCAQREVVAKFNAARRLVVPVGERFGKLTVLENLPGQPTRVRVRCDCGNERVVRTVSLLDGNTRSCGCSKIALRYRTIADQLAEVQWMRRVVDLARQLADGASVDQIMDPLLELLADEPPAIEGDAP